MAKSKPDRRSRWPSRIELSSEAETRLRVALQLSPEVSSPPRFVAPGHFVWAELAAEVTQALGCLNMTTAEFRNRILPNVKALADELWRVWTPYLRRMKATSTQNRKPVPAVLYEMDRDQIVEKMHELRKTIATKNRVMAGALDRAIVAVLQSGSSLRSDRLRSLHVSPKAADLIRRILAAESLDAIAASVPTIVTRRGWSKTRDVLDLGNWDGAWDNVVKVVEED